MGIKKKKNGFTLLELILVLAILGIIVPAGFSMFIASMRAQLKVTLLQEVKRNGDTSLNVMESLIKSRTVSLQQLDGTSICNTAGTTYSAGDVYFVDPENERFRFHLVGDTIASDSSSIGSISLTSGKVAVTDFTLTCEKETSFTTPIINIGYTVSQVNVTTRSEEQATMDYLTKVRLRTY